MEELRFLLALNAHGVNNVRQTEMLTGEPLEPEPISFEIKSCY
jgi:hypothetical protein